MHRRNRRTANFAALGRRRRRVHRNKSGIRELAEVGCFGVPTVCGKNEVLVRQGTPSKYVFGVVSGVLRAYRMLSNGRRHVTGFLMPGSFWGFEHAKGYSRGVDAVIDANLQRYERHMIEALIEREPKAGSVIFDIMSNALSEAEHLQIVVGHMSGPERLANFLLYLADRQPAPGRGEQVVVPLPMGSRDISDYLCLRLETLCRLLADLTDRRIIARPNLHNVILLRPDALEQVH